MGAVQPADSRAIRRAIWAIGAAAILAVSAIVAFEYFRDDFDAWLENNIDFLVEHPAAAFVASLILVSPVLAAAAYLLVLGNRTVRTERFPPLGYAVVRNTPVLVGRQAARRGRVIRLLSLLLMFTGGAVPVVVWYIFRSLGSPT